MTDPAALLTDPKVRAAFGRLVEYARDTTCYAHDYNKALDNAEAALLSTLLTAYRESLVSGEAMEKAVEALEAAGMVTFPGGGLCLTDGHPNEVATVILDAATPVLLARWEAKVALLTVALQSAQDDQQALRDKLAEVEAERDAAREALQSIVAKGFLSEDDEAEARAALKEGEPRD